MKFAKMAGISASTMSYSDYIRRLQDVTGLLRKTVIEIISKSGRLKEFYINPEK